MAKSNDEWELSKENIQPIKQGRKQKVLKVALAPNPDLILQQQQAFEHELRTYSGDDPLVIWYKYYKWVEQNFPKGGKEGHIKQLIEQCLSVMKDEKKYYDDERFIDIFLKFADISTKPMDVYNYMFSHNIGCKSAKFYVRWSWELEQYGNLKKADDVFNEGIKRRAEPFEKLKSSYGEFEVRLAKYLKERSKPVDDSEYNRSAFTMLKPVKKNIAPVVRTGEAVENRVPLILNRQQLQIKSGGSRKVPFTIYNSENISSSLPVQSKSVHLPVLNSEIYKENECKPSKWSKVKMKTNNQYLTSSDVDPGFEFHCDEENEEIKTPKSVHKTSNILSVRKKTQSPPMALFEPPDPLKRPMYDKNKVYGGAEEYSLEEIRAATWLDKKKKAEQDFLLAEQQRKIEEQAKNEEELKRTIEHLTQQIEFLQSNYLGSERKCKLQISKMGDTECSENFEFKNNKINQVYVNENEDKIILKEQNYGSASTQNILCNFTESNINSFPSRHVIETNCNVTDTVENECTDSTGYHVAAKMVQELYNRTLTSSTDDTGHKQNSEINFELYKKCNIPSTENSMLGASRMQSSILDKPKDDVPFTFFHDPTEIIPYSNKPTSADAPINATRGFFQNNLTCDKSPKTSNYYSSEEDVENIPPKGYVQDPNKRELAGVLEPSKNILFIPVEEQENLGSDSDSEDGYTYSNKQPLNETLIPPSNTEQFKTDKFYASTPCISSNNKNSDVQSLNHQDTSADIRNVPQNVYEENTMSVTKTSVNNPHGAVSKLDGKAINEPVSLPCLPNILSVIMERSENYSKSSSSSSSSSVNLTKSGHLDSSTNHHGSIRKHFQKLEICDPCPLSTVPEVSDSVADSSVANTPYSNITNYSFINENQIYSINDDPFDQQVNQQLLRSVKFTDYKNLYCVNKSIKTIKIGETINVGNTTYRVESLIAEGGYAKVYEAVVAFIFSGNYSVQKVALKVCKHANEWEFYICNEMQKRLSAITCLPDVKNSLMNVSSAVKYSDGIVLVNEYCELGTLLDIVNFYKKQNSTIPELIVMYLTLEILHIVSKLHECNIIHGDIKPDNFLLINNAFEYDVINHLSEYTTSLRLMDFGRAIDLNLYQKNICFTKTFSTTHFKCNEMKENKPWVFQLDWYGVLSCIHTMLFSEYMSVKKNKEKWEIEKKFKRYWHISLWEPLFSDLLNIPSCYEEPDIKKYVCMIESKLQQDSKKFILSLDRLSSSYLRKK